MRTPRADQFKVLEASDSLQELAESKQLDALLDEADLAYASPDQAEDLMEEGIRLGLMMAANGVRTAVKITICDGEAVFVGTPQDVRKRVAALEDNEPESPEEE